MNTCMINPKFVDLGELTLVDPEFGDFTLNLHPYKTPLPQQFYIWKDVVETRILSLIPHNDNSSNEHYVTITSKYFTEEGCLRREGVHIDGNFCADPTFIGETWGGTSTTWAGVHIDENLVITTPWESPYGIQPPIGKYVSSELGGIFCVSSFEGCDVWDNKIECEIGDGGSLNHFNTDEPEILKANNLYFMSSDTPHQSNIIPQGERRTLIRVTLAHDYPNEMLLI